MTLQESEADRKNEDHKCKLLAGKFLKVALCRLLSSSKFKTI